MIPALPNHLRPSRLPAVIEIRDVQLPPVIGV
jgi:hypothetical protein